MQRTNELTSFYLNWSGGGDFRPPGHIFFSRKREACIPLSFRTATGKKYTNHAEGLLRGDMGRKTTDENHVQ